MVNDRDEKNKTTSGGAAAPRPRLRRPAQPGVWPGPGGSVYWETLLQICDLLNETVKSMRAIRAAWLGRL